jgi:hypothetical protein
MNTSSHEVNHILANVGDLPSGLMTGRLCKVVCEFCPLRSWKSPAITAVHCKQILTAARQSKRLDARI